MPRLSSAQAETRARVIDLAAAGLAPEALSRRLVAAVGRAIPSDGYRLFGVDPRTLLVNRLLAASDNDGWARLEWLREVYLAAGPLDYLELPALMRANLPAVAFQDRQDRCWGYPASLLAPVAPADHHRLFHELRSPVGGTLLAGFAAGGRWVAALQAYRRDPNSPFRAGDVAFLRQLAPAIGRAIGASLAREQALAAGAGTVEAEGIEVPAASGILVIEPDGGLRFSTPAGEAWCGLLGEPERAGAAPLPTAVWSAVAGLRADPGAGASALQAVTQVGPVRIEASPAGPDGSIAVVIAPSEPRTGHELPAEWSLTPAERQVVELVALGSSNRHVAARLSIAEHTVEWHLSRAYEKIGVRGRRQLLAALFRDRYLSGLVPAASPAAPR